jgi:hypothetical protein
MKWEMLKKMKCPKCSKAIKRVAGVYACTACEFVINAERFDVIVDRLYKKGRKPSEEDNASALNNLGHEPVREDFSDSSALDI